jgi:hypothetical protein
MMARDGSKQLIQVKDLTIRLAFKDQAMLSLKQETKLLPN